MTKKKDASTNEAPASTPAPEAPVTTEATASQTETVAQAPATEPEPAPAVETPIPTAPPAGEPEQPVPLAASTAGEPEMITLSTTGVITQKGRVPEGTLLHKALEMIGVAAPNQYTIRDAANKALKATSKLLGGDQTLTLITKASGG